MSDDSNFVVPVANPEEAWEGLKSDPKSVLVDVRTIAEWDYVGEPVLDSIGKEMLKVEWMEFPEMTRNEYFAEEVLSQFDEDPSVVYFICRSGRRSEAAVIKLREKVIETGQNMRIVNVSEGFEGDHDADRHRGKVNGWKVRGLPWKQP